MILNNKNNLNIECLLKDFVDHCHDVLLNSKKNEVVSSRKYIFNERKLNKDSLLSNKIGYCLSSEKIPNEVKFFGNYSFDCSKWINGSLIVPIYDEFNILVGFSTRKPISEKGATWWNLPKPFYKSNNLFLINKARNYMFSKEKVYIVEGYFDALILHQYEIKNCVAVMSTNLSLRQIGIICRYCENICFAFDKDKNQSGQRGVNLCSKLVKKFVFCKRLTFIDLPIGVDPDEYIIRNGKESFLKLEKDISN